MEFKLWKKLAAVPRNRADATAQIGDFPGIAACAAPKPLLVNYALGDEMFPEAGMRDADAMIRRHYDRAGVPGAYTAAFHDGPHRFDRPMQGEALAWLRSQLG